MVTEKQYQLPFSWTWLAPKYWGTWLAGLLLVVFAFVPVRLRDALAKYIADKLFDTKALAKRRAIADINLRLCFPDWSPQQRRELMRQNVRIFMQLILGVGELTVRSTRHFRQRLTVEGNNHLQQLLDAKQNIIVLLPHTYAVDYAGLYLCLLDREICTMFKKTSNPVIDWAIAKQRTRLNGIIFERDAGIKVLIKATRQGLACVYLPDEDFGPKQSIMSDFFATEKATLPVLGKMAKLANAKVLPMYAAYDQQAHKVHITIKPAMADYPCLDIAADTLAMNKQVEELVMCSPEQYMWSLKLLRTVKGSNHPRY